MVVMVILFALAGAVAIGASTLLTGRTSTSATTDDFRLRSAVNDSVAQVAGLTRACSAAPPPSPRTTPSPIPSSLALALPPPDSRAQLLTRCVRMDGVAIDAVKRVPTPAPTGGCRTLDLGMKGPVRVAVVFDVYPNGTGWAYLSGDDSSQQLGCPSSLHSFRGSPSCASTFPQSPGAPPVSGPSWTQVALTCDIPDGETAQLHIRSSATSPRQVFVAAQDSGPSSQGSVYLLAVQTPVAGSPEEEALLFVSGDGKTRLLYEAPLQP
jgi:hypothetical protein